MKYYNDKIHASMKAGAIVLAMSFAAGCAVATPVRNENAGGSAASRIAVSDIAKYVYPGNAVATPGKIVFMPDGESYLKADASGKRIVRYETASGKELETVLDVTHTRESSIASVADFTLSPDGGKLLVYADKEPVYRRSFKAAYHVFEIKRNILRPLSENHAMQQAPLFSNDGRMVAFVADNNIYIKKIDYNSEVQVTSDGEKNCIINGLPDWTYEEEFSTDCSMAWAPDNSTLCYIRYDETQVPTFSFSVYEGWCEPQKEHALYPGRFSYKYPVAGEQNSRVSVHSYDVETRKIKEVPLSDPQIEYIPRISYGGGEADARLMIVTLNRAQNRMEVYAANPKSTMVKSVLVETASAWLNPASYENIDFASDGFVMFSERSGWNHLYKYSYNGQLLRQVTSGEFDVTSYYGEDAAGNIYFQSEPCLSTAADPQNALHRVVYKVDKQGKRIEALSSVQGWGTADFAPLMNYYVLGYSNSHTPNEYTLYNGKGKRLRVLEDNADYASRYAACAKKEFFTMKSDGTVLNGYMLKPKDFDPSRRYPVIMWQYSGPGSQEVTDRWRMDWDYYAVTRGFIVVCVDGRGTGGRGTAFRNVVYKRLGRIETTDQLNAAEYVASLPYVDAGRIGICGWSYGGYETLMAVTAPENRFKAAVAIAPVTSWRYYDTVYSERFMLTPGENAEGYDAGAPVNRADNMNSRLLLISGTADDNVHLSNTMEFVSRLQQADRYCDMFLFPNMNHSINGCDARALVYGRMIEYFNRNL